jgi:hypothetical protein
MVRRPPKRNPAGWAPDTALHGSATPAAPVWLGQIERLLEAHGVSLRLPTGNERLARPQKVPQALR